MNARDVIGWSLLALLVLMLVTVVAGFIMSLAAVDRAKEKLREPPPVLAPLPLPAPALESAIQGDRQVVVGTIDQAVGRLGYEPAAEVAVREWLSNATPAQKRQLSYVADGRCLTAYISGRPRGHPFPEGTVGAEYIVVVERAPRVIWFDEHSFAQMPCQLVGAYPYSPELVARVREILPQTASRPAGSTTQPDR